MTKQFIGGLPLASNGVFCHYLALFVPLSRNFRRLGSCLGFRIDKNTQVSLSNYETRVLQSPKVSNLPLCTPRCDVMAQNTSDIYCPIHVIVIMLGMKN